MIAAEMVQLVSHLKPKNNFLSLFVTYNSVTYINIGMNSSSVNVKQKVFKFLELGLMIPAEMVQLVSHLKSKRNVFPLFVTFNSVTLILV
jgi:hypothetical protein